MSAEILSVSGTVAGTGPSSISTSADATQPGVGTAMTGSAPGEERCKVRPSFACGTPPLPQATLSTSSPYSLNSLTVSPLSLRPLPMVPISIAPSAPNDSSARATSTTEPSAGIVRSGIESKCPSASPTVHPDRTASSSPALEISNHSDAAVPSAETSLIQTAGPDCADAAEIAAAAEASAIRPAATRRMSAAGIGAATLRSGW